METVLHNPKLGCVRDVASVSVAQETLASIFPKDLFSDYLVIIVALSCGDHKKYPCISTLYNNCCLATPTSTFKDVEK